MADFQIFQARQAALNDKVISEWQGAKLDDKGLEKRVGTLDFQEPWFLELGYERSRSVCIIPRLATGFLVSDDLLLTNNHVFPNERWADGVSVRFDYEQDRQGLAKAPSVFALKPEIKFVTNVALDYTLIYVDGKPGKKFGYIDIARPGRADLNMRANIIQHPNLGFKKIAIRNNEIRFLSEEVIQYITDTEHGSSGSPVFDDQWDIIGLHYRHTSSENQGDLFYNEAKNIIAIAKSLSQHL